MSHTIFHNFTYLSLHYIHQHTKCINSSSSHPKSIPRSYFYITHMIKCYYNILFHNNTCNLEAKHGFYKKCNFITPHHMFCTINYITNSIFYALNSLNPSSKYFLHTSPTQTFLLIHFTKCIKFYNSIRYHLHTHKIHPNSDHINMTISSNRPKIS